MRRILSLLLLLGAAGGAYWWWSQRTSELHADDPRLQTGESGIVILKKIQFKTGSAEILPESDPILDQVAYALKGHPEFQLVEVAGHAEATKELEPLPLPKPAR